MKPGTDAMKRFEEIKKLRENFTWGVQEIDDLIQMVDLLIRRNEIETKDYEIQSLKFKNEGLTKQIDNYRYFPERLKEEIYKLQDFVNTFKLINNTECCAYKVAKEKLELLKQIYYKY